MARLPLLLSLFVAVAAPIGVAHAGAPVTLDAARALATVPSSQLVRRLQEQHARVDQALAKRRDGFDGWQQAVLARDEAAADVQRMKLNAERGAALDRALRKALVLDEEANLARSQLMAAESEVAHAGARLLSLYDAVLTLKRREIAEVRANDSRRNKRVATYQALTAQRDRVRRSLGPVLRAGRDMQRGSDDGVQASASDDIETLLEKADLARDLEERFLRRAQAVQRRIREMMEEREVARDVAGMVRDQSLFDEDDMRLYVVSDQVSAAPGLASALPSGRASGSTSNLALPGVPSADAVARGNTQADEEVADSPGMFGGGNTDSDGAPAPPPADPAAPSAGFESAEDDGAGDLNGQPDSNRGADVVTPSIPDVGGAALPRSAVRAFSAGSADVDLEALLASGELTLPQLRALDKRLRERAKKMRKQEAELKREVDNRARR